MAIRRLRRMQVLDWFGRFDRADECVVGLAVTSSAHYWRGSIKMIKRCLS